MGGICFDLTWAHSSLVTDAFLSSTRAAIVGVRFIWIYFVSLSISASERVNLAHLGCFAILSIYFIWDCLSARRSERVLSSLFCLHYPRREHLWTKDMYGYDLPLCK